MMPILVKSDDVGGGRKAKARHGQLQAAQESIGRSEIHQGTGASFEFLLIDKLTPPHERSC